MSEDFLTSSPKMLINSGSFTQDPSNGNYQAEFRPQENLIPRKQGENNFHIVYETFNIYCKSVKI